MSKKLKAAMVGLAFVAGCEIGIAIQLMKMIHKYTIKESAAAQNLPEDEEIDEALEAEEIDEPAEIPADDDEAASIPDAVSGATATV